MDIIESLKGTLKPHQTAKSAMISYRATPETKQKLKQFAQNHNMTMQELISTSLLTYIKQESK